MPVLVKVLHRRRDIETERHRYLERDTGMGPRVTKYIDYTEVSTHMR